MFRFFMSRIRFSATISFHQNKTRRVILPLDKIEARDPRFFHAFARIGDGRQFECLDEFRLNMNLDMNDKHGSFINRKSVRRK